MNERSCGRNLGGRERRRSVAGEFLRWSISHNTASRLVPPSMANVLHVAGNAYSCPHSASSSLRSLGVALLHVCLSSTRPVSLLPCSTLELLLPAPLYAFDAVLRDSRVVLTPFLISSNHSDSPVHRRSRLPIAKAATSVSHPSRFIRVTPPTPPHPSLIQSSVAIITPQ